MVVEFGGGESFLYTYIHICIFILSIDLSLVTQLIAIASHEYFFRGLKLRERTQV